MKIDQIENEQRFKIIHDLVHWEKSITELEAELSNIEFWDQDAFFALGREEVVSILVACIEGRKPIDSLEGWANLIEMRDEIEYEKKHEKIIVEIIHELANPTLFEKVDNATCKKLVSRLQQ